MDLESLKIELAENLATIANLKQQLANLKQQIFKDNTDLALAENRAKIGDIANARGHLQNIDAREQQRIKQAQEEAIYNRNSNLQTMQEQEQKKAKIKQLIADIEDLDLNKSTYQNFYDKQGFDKKRQRLVNELKEYGVDYDQTNNIIQNNNAGELDLNKSQNWSEYEWDLFKTRFLDIPNPQQWAKDFYLQRPTTSVEVEESKKAVANKKTEEQKQKETQARLVRLAKANSLFDKYALKSNSIDFLNRWNKNDNTDKEIKLLKEFYDLKNGFLIKKGK